MSQGTVLLSQRSVSDVKDDDYVFPPETRDETNPRMSLTFFCRCAVWVRGSLDEPLSAAHFAHGFDRHYGWCSYYFMDGEWHREQTRVCVRGKKVRERYVVFRFAFDSNIERKCGQCSGRTCVFGARYFYAHTNARCAGRAVSSCIAPRNDISSICVVRSDSKAAFPAVCSVGLCEFVQDCSCAVDIVPSTNLAPIDTRHVKHLRCTKHKEGVHGGLLHDAKGRVSLFVLESVSSSNLRVLEVNSNMRFTRLGGPKKTELRETENELVCSVCNGCVLVMPVRTWKRRGF